MAPARSFSREAPVVKIEIDGKEEPLLQPLRVEWSIGGKRLDFAEFELDHGKSRKHREEFRKWVGGKFYDAHEVKILVKIDDKQKIAHVGRMAIMKVEVDGSTERLIFRSRLENWHFGKPLVGIRCFEPRDRRFPALNDFGSRVFDGDQGGGGELDERLAVHLHDKVVFNPDRDGTVYGSMITGSAFEGARVFAPANLIPPASLSQAPYPEIGFWELNDVILYLCQTLNQKQEIIDNPTENSLKTQIGNVKGLVRNVKLRQGRYLNQLLDDLLEPLGYAWFLEYRDDKPKIRLYLRPDGVGAGIGDSAVKAMLRIPENEQEDSGFPLDLETMNVARLNLTIDKSAASNEVGVLGDFVEVESTFELHRGWPADKDDLADGETLIGANVRRDENKDVWRRWVLNETGEYTGLRPEISEAFRFDALFGISEWTESRRRFLPTITTDEHGEPIGKANQLEYLNMDKNEWEIVERANWSFLEDECGIYFDSLDAPDELTDQAGKINLNNTTGLRITATVRGDRKIGSLAERPKDAANKDKVREVIQAPGRFKRRIVHADSIFAAVVAAGGGAKVTDDKREILAYAEALRDSVQRVHTSGTLTLEGVEPAFTSDKGEPVVGLGWNVKEIEGAGIKLGSLEKRDAAPFPTVAGITMDFQKQRTVVTLEAFTGRLA